MGGGEGGQVFIFRLVGGQLEVDTDFTTKGQSCSVVAVRSGH